MVLRGGALQDPDARDDLREAVTTLEETERTARRVLGGAHPLIVEMEPALKNSRAALRAREATTGTSSGTPSLGHADPAAVRSK